LLEISRQKFPVRAINRFRSAELHESALGLSEGQQQRLCIARAIDRFGDGVYCGVVDRCLPE
jgi:ABC-type phosphate transport system ATPase subunit